MCQTIREPMRISVHTPADARQLVHPFDETTVNLDDVALNVPCALRC